MKLIVSTLFTVHSVHSDYTVTLVDFIGNLFYELRFEDIYLF